jgi:hypothetical protein
MLRHALVPIESRVYWKTVRGTDVLEADLAVA